MSRLCTRIILLIAVFVGFFIPAGGDVTSFGSSSLAPKSALTPQEIKRIQNAADRIDKDITVVGSRASGKTNPTSDWDYVVEGMTNKQKLKLRIHYPEQKIIEGKTLII